MLLRLKYLLFSYQQICAHSPRAHRRDLKTPHLTETISSRRFRRLRHFWCWLVGIDGRLRCVYVWRIASARESSRNMKIGRSSIDHGWRCHDPTPPEEFCEFFFFGWIGALHHTRRWRYAFTYCKHVSPIIRLGTLLQYLCTVLYLLLLSEKMLSKLQMPVCSYSKFLTQTLWGVTEPIP